MLDSGDIASMIVALIAAYGAYAAHRASGKATAAQASTTADANTAIARTNAEEQAYVRARKFDSDTIERQDRELDELRESNRLKEEELKLLRPLVEEVRILRARVQRLERNLTSHEKEPNDDQHDRHVPLPSE